MKKEFKNHYDECKKAKGSIGYTLIQQAKREERSRILKELPEKIKGSISIDINPTKTSVAFRRGFNVCLKQIKNIITNK